jgi:hypothetical protein
LANHKPSLSFPGVIRPVRMTTNRSVYQGFTLASERLKTINNPANGANLPDSVKPLVQLMPYQFIIGMGQLGVIAAYTADFIGLSRRHILFWIKAPATQE